MIKNIDNLYSYKKIKRNHILIEISVWTLATASIIYLLSSLLIYNKVSMLHDNIYWNYPVFQFFAESIINKNLPLWNPFSHAGEIFYSLPFMNRDYSPITVLIIYLGNFITNEIQLIFNWNIFIRILVSIAGIYILFRSFTRHLFVRLTLIPILTFSSFILLNFRTDCFISHFIWTPYIAYFLLRIIYKKDYSWYNWLILACLIGLNWQANNFISTWIFFLFFAVGIILFHRCNIKDMLKSRKLIIKLAVFIFIILGMMLPNIYIIMEQNRLVFPVRMANNKVIEGTPQLGPQQYEGMPQDIVKGINMPYEVISKTGTFSNLWDFIQIISPDGNPFISWEDRIFWGRATEAFIYIGLLPWAIAILGIVAGQHELKKLWLIILTGFGLLMLGPAGGLHKVLYYLYPPIWFIRHTHVFVLFFLFSFMYFYVLGFNYIIDNWTRKRLFIEDTNKKIFKHPGFYILIICIVLSVCFMAELKYPNSDYLFLYIIPILLLGFILRKKLGKKGIYISIIVSHIVIVMYFNPNILLFLIYIYLCFILPILLFLFLKKYRFRELNIFSKTVLIISVFSVCLISDLLYSFCKSNTLYTTPNILKYDTADINTKVQKPSLPDYRLISPEPHYSNNRQSMRYLSILNRKSYAFSPLIEAPYIKRYYKSSIKDKKGLSPGTFNYALEGVRWNSYMLFKNYFNLIHSGIPTDAMKRMFAADNNIFQYKKGAIALKDSEAYQLLKDMGSSKSSLFLENNIIIDKTGKSDFNINDIDKEINKNEFKYLIKDYNHNSIQMEITSKKAGFLYWADGYDKWWQAYINKKKTPIYRANINFKTIQIPAGVSLVEFVYNPVWFTRSLLVFYGIIFASLIISIINFISLKRKNDV